MMTQQPSLPENMHYPPLSSHEAARSVPEDFKWNRDSVLLLISLYQSKKSQFVSGFVKKRDLWSEVAAAMTLQGFSVSMIACEKKWHNLCATYRKLKECSLKKRTCWQYFQPLQEALEDSYSNQNMSLNGNLLIRDGSGCNIVKIESPTIGESSSFASSPWPSPYHSQVRNSADAESGNCEQDINNMLSVSIDENMDHSQMSRDGLIATPATYVQGNPDDFKWTHNSVMLLCSLYLARKEQFLSGAVKKRDLWTDIAQELNREGFSATCIACEKKWHNLIATYKKVTMYSRKKTWPYLRIFHKIVEEQERRSALLNEQCNIPISFAQDVADDSLKNRFYGKDDALNASQEAVLYRDNIHHMVSEEFKWTHVSVISLCTLYQERRHEFFSNTVRKRDLWMEIASEMNTQGFNVTWVHCEKKWYNLYATYKKVIDQNRKRVRVWSTWPYLKLFQDIFSSQNNSQDSLHGNEAGMSDNRCDIDSDVPYSAASPASNNSDNSPDAVPLNDEYHKHSSKKQCINYAPEWFLDYMQQQKELEEHRREQAERHHQELLQTINIGNSALLELSSHLKIFLQKSM